MDLSTSSMKQKIQGHLDIFGHYADFRILLGLSKHLKYQISTLWMICVSDAILHPDLTLLSTEPWTKQPTSHIASNQKAHLHLLDLKQESILFGRTYEVSLLNELKQLFSPLCIRICLIDDNYNVLPTITVTIWTIMFPNMPVKWM